jgi:uncharacterized protein YbjT (DUF2867 family)
MRVLVTGATGYLGGAIVRALLAGGHDVIGLVRDTNSRLPTRVQPRRGDLIDTASLVAAVEDVDGVIHAGASRDDADGSIDLAATRALLDALAGSGRFGAGDNRWSVVHVDDLAELYRLVAERAPAGSVYNAVGEIVRSGDAARAAADAAGARVEPWPPGEAEKAWGGWAEAFRLDHVVSSDRARRELGWSPSRHGLVEELRGLTQARRSSVSARPTPASGPLPVRSGPRPDTIGPRPHAQVSQQSPPEIHRQVAARALELRAVSRADSLVSVPGAIAFVLDEAAAGGPPEAFQVQREFAHLHPEEDGSLHMTLPPDLAAEAYEKGWAEPHPLSGTPLVYAPRDQDELEVVLRLLRASYEYAVGPFSVPERPGTGAERVSFSTAWGRSRGSRGGARSARAR